MRSDHTYKKSYVFPHRRLPFYANLCCRVTPAGARLHDFLCFSTPAGGWRLLRPPSGSDFVRKVLGIYVYSTKAAATGVSPADACLHDFLCFSTPAGGVRTFTPTLGVGLCAESPRNLRILCEGSRHGGVTSGSELRITFKFSLVTISLRFRASAPVGRVPRRTLCLNSFRWIVLFTASRRAPCIGNVVVHLFSHPTPVKVACHPTLLFLGFRASAPFGPP